MKTLGFTESKQLSIASYGWLRLLTGGSDRRTSRQVKGLDCCDAGRNQYMEPSEATELDTFYRIAALAAALIVLATAGVF